MKYVVNVEYCENQITLRQLKFERAIERCDYHDANIACAQKEYWERELERQTTTEKAKNEK